MGDVEHLGLVWLSDKACASEDQRDANVSESIANYADESIVFGHEVCSSYKCLIVVTDVLDTDFIVIVHVTTQFQGPAVACPQCLLFSEKKRNPKATV